MQGAFLQPPMVLQMTAGDDRSRAALVGGVAEARRRLTIRVGGLALAALVVAWLAGLVGNRVAVLLLATIGAAAAALFREFYRMVLLAYRRPDTVLLADLAYVAILAGSVLAGTFTPYPATVSTLGILLACVAGGALLDRGLQAFAPWRPVTTPGILASLAPVGAWSVVGAATHWAFSQGYNYVTAGALEVAAVAALAATRLTLMPINVLSAGIGSLMMPIASQWLRADGPRAVFRRLATVAGVVAILALGYFVCLWLVRDWVFLDLMGKDFGGRDPLLLAWAGIVLVTVFRDQLLYLPGASGRFREMAFTALFAAGVSLLVTWAGLASLGVVGALLGVLAGELVNLAGIVFLSVREMRAPARLAPVSP
jgi:O-antigen/teichoic acid export membrane protein